jgi:hypothetical protein
VIPGDKFVAGQLVRLSLERGDPQSALEHALECGAERWWCNALRGHVLHMIGREDWADSVWTSTLYAMPLAERCLWLDPTDVIASDSLRRVVSGMDCDSRVRFAERLWWLSDPLYVTVGNERRSEHLSRQVALLLDAFSRQRLDSTYVDMLLRGLRQTESESQLVAGGDFSALFRNDPPDITVSRVFAPAPLGYEEVVRRLGVPGYFHLTRPDPGFVPQMVAMLPRPRFAFVPSAEVLADHTRARASGWSLQNERPFEFWSVGRRFEALDFQAATFRRGDSARIVVATDLSPHPELARGGATAALILRRDYADAGVQLQRRLRGNLYVEAVDLRGGRTLVSVEVLSRDGSVAGRARFGAGRDVTTRQRVAISDVMLIEARSRLPASLDEAESLILGSDRLNRRSGVGLFWELYGLAAGEVCQLHVELVSEVAGVLPRLARTLRGRPLADRLSASFALPQASGAAIEPGSVHLDLAALVPGRYTMTVQIDVVGHAPLRHTRAVEVLDR